MARGLLTCTAANQAKTDRISSDDLQGIPLHVLEKLVRKFAPPFAEPGQGNLGDLPCKVPD
jgi:hypothetical protein